MSHYKKVPQAPSHRCYSPVDAVTKHGDYWIQFSPKVSVSTETREALRGQGPEWHDFIRMICCEKGMVSRA